MKIFIFSSFMLLILTAVGCSDNDACQGKNPTNNNERGFAIPQAIKPFASTENDNLKASIIIDGGEPQAMEIKDGRVLPHNFELTPGKREFKIVFKYISVEYNKTFTVATAVQEANLTPGCDNDIDFEGKDFKIDCVGCDDDGDDIENIVELAGGTNPANSTVEPTFTSRNSLKIAEKTDAVLLTLTSKDPNEDTVSFSISGGEHEALFELTSAGELRFKSTSDFKTNRGNNNQYIVEVTATDDDGANATSLPITVTVVHFFVANNGIHGEELWISDGVKDGPGTVMVKDINPEEGHSSPAYFAFLNGEVFFSAYDEEKGRELWKSDGTARGTERVKDINPSGDSAPTGLTVMNRFVYFSAFDGTDTELWKSDGTDANTRMVKDINTTGHSFPFNFTPVNDKLYFRATRDLFRQSLWKSDGSDTGTELVARSSVINFVVEDPSGLIDVDGTLFFSAPVFSFGTPVSGTLRLFKSRPNNSAISVNDSNGEVISTPTNLVNFSGTLYFSSDHEFSTGDGIGRELWKTNMTDPANPVTIGVLAQDINTSPNIDSFPANLTIVKDAATEGTLFFSADDGENGRELWQSDAANPPSFKMIDINIGPDSSFPSELINVNGLLFFSATNGVSGFELWKANSSTNSPPSERVVNINQSGDSFPRDMKAVNDALFFSANDGTNGRELWHNDGINTYQVKNINGTPESAIPDRRGLVALYEFNEGAGSKLIKDESNVGAGEALIIDDIDAVNWVTGGLSIDEPVLIHSAGGVAKINQAIKSTNELTLELWIQPEKLEQGPEGSSAARIVSISSSRLDRNITISQNSTQLNFRIRTNETNENGQNYDTLSASSPIDTFGDLSSTTPQHVVLTRNAKGQIFATLNGIKLNLTLAGSPPTPVSQWPGDFSNWDITLPLVIGNELVGSFRNWLGTIFRVAIYNCALSDEQIAQNYRAGSEEPLSKNTKCAPR